METFYSVIVAGMAVAFLLSVLELAVSSLISARVLRLVLAWPLGYVAVSFTGITEIFLFLVSGTAAAFFAVTILRVIERTMDKPTIVDRRRL